jgi:hypothetical protein
MTEDEAYKIINEAGDLVDQATKKLSSVVSERTWRYNFPLGEADTLLEVFEALLRLRDRMDAFIPDE